MPNGVGGGEEQQGGGEGSESCSDPNPIRGSGSDPLVCIVVSQPEEVVNAKAGIPKNSAVEKDDKVGIAPLAAVVVAPAAAKKDCLSRSDSYDEQCRICQQDTEEPLLDLGCRCRGELAKAHRSCIEIWFRTRGSNKCEICQQVAANIPSPDSHPTTNYWVWRVDSAYGGTNIGRGDRARGCFSPLWVAFTILIGGLLLDVLISVSLGVSALPVNIIIGVLIVLGLWTALRLALQCCHDWGARRPVERTDMTMNTGYQPTV